MNDQAKKPAKPEAPFDQRLANESAAVEACMKMGAVVLRPNRRTGFGDQAGAQPLISPEDP